RCTAGSQRTAVTHCSGFAPSPAYQPKATPEAAPHSHTGGAPSPRAALSGPRKPITGGASTLAAANRSHAPGGRPPASAPVALGADGGAGREGVCSPPGGAWRGRGTPPAPPLSPFRGRKATGAPGGRAAAAAAPPAPSGRPVVRVDMASHWRSVASSEKSH